AMAIGLIWTRIKLWRTPKPWPRGRKRASPNRICNEQARLPRGSDFFEERRPLDLRGLGKHVHRATPPDAEAAVHSLDVASERRGIARDIDQSGRLARHHDGEHFLLHAFLRRIKKKRRVRRWRGLQCGDKVILHVSEEIDLAGSGLPARGSDSIRAPLNSDRRFETVRQM